MIRSQRLRLSRGGFPSVFVRLSARWRLLPSPWRLCMSARHPPRCQRTATASSRPWTTGPTLRRHDHPEGVRFRQPTQPGGYANAVASAAGGFYARLDRRNESCFRQTGGGGDAVLCQGPFSNGAATTARGPPAATRRSSTSILTPGTPRRITTASAETWPASCRRVMPTYLQGHALDYSSAINNTSGNHLRDFGFNVSTRLVNDDCTGFTVLGTTNVDRIGANPNLPGHQCIETSGWYTFATFSAENGFLKVLMEIIPASGGADDGSLPSRGLMPSGPWAATGTAGSRTRKSGACRSTTPR